MRGCESVRPRRTVPSSKSRAIFLQSLFEPQCQSVALDWPFTSKYGSASSSLNHPHFPSVSLSEPHDLKSIEIFMQSEYHERPAARVWVWGRVGSGERKGEVRLDFIPGMKFKNVTSNCRELKFSPSDLELSGNSRWAPRYTGRSRSMSRFAPRCKVRVGVSVTVTFEDRTGSESIARCKV